MNDLHTTLTAKVTAHLELAQAATQGRWSWSRQKIAAGETKPEDYAHIEANQPQHVIRACHADLERLELHKGILINTDEEPGWELNCWTCRGRPPSPCPEVRLIASVYGVEEK
jgi:hypothetical protein